MFEELNAHRQAVQENIKKAFEIGFTGNEYLEKAYQVGDEATDKHGVTYYVHALNAAGKPLWRKKKDSGANANNSSSTGRSTGAPAAQPAATQKPAAQTASLGNKPAPAVKTAPGTIKINSQQDVKDLIKKIKSKKVTIGIRGNQRRDGSYDIVGRVTGGDYSFWDNGHLETNGGQLNIKWLGNGELEKRKFYSYRALQKFLESGDVQISYK